MLLFHLFKKNQLSILAFIFTSGILTFAELKTDRTMLLAGRFFGYWGSFGQIFIFGLYAFLITPLLLNKRTFIKTKKIIWFSFSCFFFAQFVLGTLVNDVFLMTGKLHFPIPMMILGGPLYRGEMTFMTILFLFTIFLSGPIWCSSLCYFGAIDYLSSKPGRYSKPIKSKYRYPLKAMILILTITGALVLRFFNISYLVTFSIVLTFGITGLFIVLLLSPRQLKMVHCTSYCPVHTIVMFLKYLNPFRIIISQKLCNRCMKCVSVCKYSALSAENLTQGKPGLTCTNCNDCITVCDETAITYSFFHLRYRRLYEIYMLMIIILHSTFFALARI